jgi:16S rRNA (cytidine1402-2'-O)-methyltransferase
MAIGKKRIGGPASPAQARPGQSEDAVADNQDRLAGKGALYLVATPIGNLGDLSRRAEQVLADADLVAAEDTRVTRGLLTHLGLSKPLVACHQHNEQASASGLMAALAQGKRVALVSDAGTPGISDPGFAAVQAAIQAGHAVVPVPGASAALAALTASGLAPQPFYFGGFLPRQSKQRREQAGALKGLKATLVFYESPHRVRECLQDLAQALGPRPACLGRELTKLHEEFVRGTLEELAVAGFAERGEFTLVVQGAPEPKAPDPQDLGPQELARLLEQAMAQGKSRNQAVASVARAAGLSREEVYRKAHGL